MKNTSQIWPEGRNVLRYDREMCVLSDFHSPVAVGAWDTDEMGITQQYFQGYSPSAEFAVFDPFLRLFVQSGGEWQPVPVLERTCWPGGWIEHGCAAGVEIVQRVWFCCHNELRVAYEVTPVREDSASVRLAFGGGTAFAKLFLHGAARGEELQVRIGSGKQSEHNDPEFVAEMTVRTDPAWDRCRFRPRLSQNSLAPKEEELSDTDESSPSFGYWLELPGVTCTQKDPGTVEFAAAWTFHGAVAPAPAEKYGFEENIERWRSLIERLPLPTQNMYWRRKGALAAAGLVTSLIQSPGYGNMQDKLGIGARTLGHLSRSYFWDTMTTVPVLAQLDSAWGAEVIENFTQHLGNHDCPPFAISAFPSFKGQKRSWRGSQAPIAGWAVQKLVKCTGQTELVSRLYPELKKINESWFEHADPDGDGIPVWVNTGATADNSPLYDMYAGAKDWTNIYLPAIASTCLCSYLLMDMKCLKQMAQLLGREDEAGAWQKKAEALETKMLDLLWDDEDKIFYDRDLTIHRPTRIKTFYSLMPLWAGINLPEADARAAIEGHLLNPDEMWGEVPFPSVAYNEPTYDPTGYWRGRGWPHIYFWNTEILAKYGYEKEADEAKRRFLSLAADTVEPPENFVSTIKTANRRDHGFPLYSWGMATTLYFLWDWHHQPV